LNHLARTGHLNDFLSPNQALNPNSQGSQQLRNGRPSLGMIEVIHATGISDLPWGFGVMTMMPHIGPSPQFSSGKRKRSEPELILGFTDPDKEGTT